MRSLRLVVLDEARNEDVYVARVEDIREFMFSNDGSEAFPMPQIIGKALTS